MNKAHSANSKNYQPHQCIDRQHSGVYLQYIKTTISVFNLKRAKHYFYYNSFFFSSSCVDLCLYRSISSSSSVQYPFQSFSQMPHNIHCTQQRIRWRCVLDSPMLVLVLSVALVLTTKWCLTCSLKNMSVTYW